MSAAVTRGPDFAALAGLAWLVIVADLVVKHSNLLLFIDEASTP